MELYPTHGFSARPGHFRVHFKNGWQVSTTFRDGSYSENYNLIDISPDQVKSTIGSHDAEVLVESPEGVSINEIEDLYRYIFGDKTFNENYMGFGIMGYVKPEDLSIILAIVSQK